MCGSVRAVKQRVSVFKSEYTVILIRNQITHSRHEITNLPEHNKWKSKTSRHGAKKSCPLCAMGDYDWQSSASNMLHTLNWIPLEKRRDTQCLSTLHKLALDINVIYATKKTSRLRRTHDQQYNCNSSFITSSQFQPSFFPSTIAEWNQLPNHLVTVKSCNIFKSPLLII